jgi:DNA processing protein
MPRDYLTAEERLAWLRLWRSERMGPMTFRRALQSFDSAATAIELLPQLSRNRRAAPIEIYPASAAAAEVERLAKLGGRFIACCEPDFPIALATIADAPPVIAALGDASVLRQRMVAVVGARNASANGQFLAEAIARQLGEMGWAIVSGLARGIDAAAHRGALATGTIAVLAGGIDKPYPPETAALYDEIAGGRGLLLAESPLGYAPHARDFPRRNRIVSGIAEGVVVVEAAVRSGSLITARLAGEQGRQVMAVPGSPLDPRCRGANQLIREGALLVENASDIHEAVQGLAGDARPGYDHGGNELEDMPEPDELTDIPAESSTSVVERYLSLTPVAVDELLRQCQLSAPFLRLTLLELELAGRLQWHPGNRVSLLATG